MPVPYKPIDFSVFARKSKPSKIESVVTQSESESELQEVLPIMKYREEIVKKINGSHVTIISAATGSGKVIKA